MENLLVPSHQTILIHNVQIVHGQFMISVPSTLAFELLVITICTFLISLFWVKKNIFYYNYSKLTSNSFDESESSLFSAILLVAVDVLSVMNKVKTKNSQEECCQIK